MRYELLDRPSYTVARVEFERAGERLLADPLAVVARESGIHHRGPALGAAQGDAARPRTGLAAALDDFVRSRRAGMHAAPPPPAWASPATLTASAPREHAFVAPPLEGDLAVLELEEVGSLLLGSHAFVASASTVTLDGAWTGSAAFFTPAGGTLLRVGGSGPLFVGGYGGHHIIDLDASGYTCEVGHVLAFTQGLDYDVAPVARLGRAGSAGDGRLARFEGRGRLYLSTRDPANLRGFAERFRRTSGRD